MHGIVNRLGPVVVDVLIVTSAVGIAVGLDRAEVTRLMPVFPEELEVDDIASGDAAPRIAVDDLSAPWSGGDHLSVELLARRRDPHVPVVALMKVQRTGELVAFAHRVRARGRSGAEEPHRARGCRGGSARLASSLRQDVVKLAS